MVLDPGVLAAAHSISVSPVTAPDTVEPSFSFSVSTPLENDTTVAALSLGAVVVGAVASLGLILRVCVRM